MRLWRLLVTLALMHIGHHLLHSLKHLGLHQQDFLQSRQGWRVGSIVLVVGVVIPCVDQLMD
jgi:hypothetical protein